MEIFNILLKYRKLPPVQVPKSQKTWQMSTSPQSGQSIISPRKYNKLIYSHSSSSSCKSNYSKSGLLSNMTGKSMIKIIFVLHTRSQYIEHNVALCAPPAHLIPAHSVVTAPLTPNTDDLPA